MSLTRWSDGPANEQEAKVSQLFRAARARPVPAAPPLSPPKRAGRGARRLAARSVFLLSLPAFAAVLASVRLLAPGHVLEDVRGPRRSPQRVAVPSPVPPALAAPEAEPALRSAGSAELGETEAERSSASTTRRSSLPEPAVSSAVSAERGAFAAELPGASPALRGGPFEPGEQGLGSPPPRRAPPAAATVEQGAPRESPSVGLPAPESTLGEEARLLGLALEALRDRRDPAAALGLLERYRAQFPAGVLWPEATLARAQAYRAAGRIDEALSALAALDEAGSSRAEVLVLRGELLAERADCAAALPLLEAATQRTPAGPVAERAAFTRASCAVTSFDPDARALLERYLTRWPGGASAARARELLETLP